MTIVQWISMESPDAMPHANRGIAELFLHLTEDEAIQTILQGNTLDEIHFSCIDELTEEISWTEKLDINCYILCIIYILCILISF